MKFKWQFVERIKSAAHVTSIYIDEGHSAQKCVVRRVNESGDLVMGGKRQYYHSLRFAGEFHSLEDLEAAILKYERRKK